MKKGGLADADLRRLKALDTCTVSNAIERLEVRPRNEGFVRDAVRCLFPEQPPLVGYAVTAIVRTSAQPVGGGWYFDHIDWWRHFLTGPTPRVMVLQDIDETPGVGAFVGGIHANIASALDCVGCVTNGAVRDLPDVASLGFQLFAGTVSPSHAYAHIVRFGEPVEIGGLTIEPGDLIHGDRHGLQVVPLSIAAEIPAVAAGIKREERALIDLCRSPEFSLDALSSVFDRMREAAADKTAHSPSPRNKP